MRLREELHTHHISMPWQLLLAAISTALLWGWPRVAGVLALTWSAVLRIGETLSATRGDLLLPSDLAGSVHFALLGIAARHQAACLDQPDFLTVNELAFKDLPLHCKLWPMSASTLR